MRGTGPSLATIKLPPGRQPIPASVATVHGVLVRVPSVCSSWRDNATEGAPSTSSSIVAFKRFSYMTGKRGNGGTGTT